MTKYIVEKIEENTDRNEVLCTTYQMRNFYQQFKDGFITGLDVMNFIQHEAAVMLARPEDRILDICCGRGLLLPMLRLQKKDIESYTGVDIKPSNALFRTRRVTDGKPVSSGYYPFKVYFVEHNVSTMASTLPNDYFTYLVYTSSIEHMHPDHGMQSLIEARKVAKTGAQMFFSCPNTPEDQDGYDTRYAAHVYEWKQSELLKGFKKSKWQVEDTFGLMITANALQEKLKEAPALQAIFSLQRKTIPWHWLAPFYAAMFPNEASEIGFILKAI